MDYMQMLPEYGDILLPEDLQKILHAGRNTIYKYLAEGKIRSLMIGGKYKIPKLYLLEFLYPDMIFSKEAVNVGLEFQFNTLTLKKDKALL